MTFWVDQKEGSPTDSGAGQATRILVPVSCQHRDNRGNEATKVPRLCLSNRITNIINILVFYGVFLGN